MPVCVLIPICRLVFPLPVMGICAFWYQHIYLEKLNTFSQGHDRQNTSVNPKKETRFIGRGRGGGGEGRGRGRGGGGDSYSISW